MLLQEHSNLPLDRMRQYSEGTPPVSRTARGSKTPDVTASPLSDVGMTMDDVATEMTESSLRNEQRRLKELCLARDIYMMSSSSTKFTDSPQEDYDPDNWTALQEDCELSYIGTPPVNARDMGTQPVNAHDIGTQPVNAQDTHAQKFNGMNRRALNHYPKGVPIGTFKPDHVTDPSLRRLVYAKLDKYSKPYLLLSSLGTDCGTYVCPPNPVKSEELKSRGILLPTGTLRRRSSDGYRRFGEVGIPPARSKKSHPGLGCMFFTGPTQNR